MALTKSCALSIVLVICSVAHSVISQGTTVTFNDDSRATIVRAHNDLRSEVNPSATNMLMMASTILLRDGSGIVEGERNN